MAAALDPDFLPMPWVGGSDAELLCALALRDEDALRELHRRYAPAVYALAHRTQVANLDQGVQDAFLAIWRHAECHSRSCLDARTWMLILAHRSLRPA
ncbi:sigma factor [Deinococcus sp. QL22]|uniref:sigma factor n=1 Tax=Deinococcus sp. QL22 TaxID=2939437 RepID=UPI002017EFD2|nr:sigma factor [Deinococcus sp. QL22]UQN08037.1 hypothetical protein M1R55_18265 [Deinococcus sp. QL22]